MVCPFPESFALYAGRWGKEKEGEKKRKETNSGVWRPKNKTNEMCVCGLRTNRTESSVPCHSSGPGLSEQAKETLSWQGRRVWQGGSLHQGDTGGGHGRDALMATQCSFCCFPACLSRAERQGGGRAAAQEGGLLRRRAVLSRASSGVTPGQCPPVPGSSFKIAVVSFV